MGLDKRALTDTETREMLAVGGCVLVNEQKLNSLFGSHETYRTQVATLRAALRECVEALEDAVAIIDNRDRGFDPTVSALVIKQQVVDAAETAIERGRKELGE